MSYIKAFFPVFIFSFVALFSTGGQKSFASQEEVISEQPKKKRNEKIERSLGRLDILITSKIKQPLTLEEIDELKALENRREDAQKDTNVHGLNNSQVARLEQLSKMRYEAQLLVEEEESISSVLSFLKEKKGEVGKVEFLDHFKKIKSVFYRQLIHLYLSKLYLEGEAFIDLKGQLIDEGDFMRIYNIFAKERDALINKALEDEMVTIPRDAFITSRQAVLKERIKLDQSPIFLDLLAGFDPESEGDLSAQAITLSEEKDLTAEQAFAYHQGKLLLESYNAERGDKLKSYHSIERKIIDRVAIKDALSNGLSEGYDQDLYVRSIIAEADLRVIQSYLDSIRGAVSIKFSSEKFMGKLLKKMALEDGVLPLFEIAKFVDLKKEMEGD
ncbi:hypothetical protein [Candidatus Nucleicultrix amoebiphila]|jgi:hypothetical protein|uniref:Uncharacterized protein n=1 Tax=Candidatus Nucleicultrix amoebiphila FS5 TaxID=1414854 RepID=A0A1W6N6C4_9PROT|nr:hypothetical protein [Candidatus Nucleicultrix amoebiphila]ARN85296.1 hypothetical protein GQ61_08370 [Candidatus Nucleicultrix amoebiphila FS5]